MKRGITIVLAVLLAIAFSATPSHAAAIDENDAAIAVVERDGGGATVLYIEGQPPRMHRMHELGERPIAWAGQHG